MRKLASSILTGLIVTGLLYGASGSAGAASDEKKERPLVQIAVLLDTSGSMQGMIDQAKAQLWSIVNEFATAERDGRKPALQVALYRYGTPSLGADNGYIRQLSPLTDDLDSISEKLFALTTSGGDEYCGWVIDTAADQLKWSKAANDYKAIFIAGNEAFDQGKVDYRKAIKAAFNDGIVVNTIHCAGGSNSGWAEAAKLAEGRFMRIDGNKKVVEIDAPQDKKIRELNAQLNNTYVAYGARGEEKGERQRKVDTLSRTISGANLAKRAEAKASAQYRNSSWDLVDAVEDNEVALENVSDKDLPREMLDMTPAERKAYIEKKQEERAKLQEEIRKLSEERAKYVAEKKREMADSNDDTLGNKVRKAVREQAADKGFTFSR